jgi:hypothetical protein
MSDEGGTNMDAYRAQVEGLMRGARERVARGGVFSNKGIPHARIVVDTMLASATQSVMSYSRLVSNDVYDASKLRACIDRAPSHVTMSFLVEQGNVWTDTASALSWLGKVPPEARKRVEVRLNTKAPSSHMLIVDGVHTRVETSQISREAVASFGDADFAAGPRRAFQALWNVGTPLPWPAA